MKRPTNPAERWIPYRIKVNQPLDPKWAERLPGRILHLKKDPTEEFSGTEIILAVPDQAALRSLLNQLWDLNLSLLQVVQIENLTGEGEQDG